MCINNKETIRLVKVMNLHTSHTTVSSAPSHLDQRGENDDGFLLCSTKPLHDIPAWKCCFEGHQHHHGLPQDTGDTQDEGNAKGRVSQHAGPRRRAADKGEGAEEAKVEGEEQQEAQLRVVGSDDGRAPVAREDEEDAAGAEGAQQGDGGQGDADGIAEGQELHRFGDTGRHVLIGPELWQAAHTLNRI